MWKTSESLLEEAKREASKMLTKGEKISPLIFGGWYSVIFISSDPDLVNGFDKFEVEGKTFFVGTKKKGGVFKKQ